MAWLVLFAAPGWTWYPRIFWQRVGRAELVICRGFCFVWLRLGQRQYVWQLRPFRDGSHFAVWPA